MSQENLQIVRSIYEAFERRDAPALFDVLDPKVKWRWADNWIYADRNQSPILRRHYHRQRSQNAD